MTTQIREGKVLDNGDVVCPYCNQVVPDSAQTNETIQLTLLGGVVIRAFFDCSHCGKRFIVVIVEEPNQC